jgi:hypothetical protein
MTEAEWLACQEPGPMLECLRGKASERKLRLFVWACCRRVWPLLDRLNRAVVVAGEKHADGLLGRAEVEALRQAAEPPHDDDSPQYMAGEAARLGTHADLEFAVNSALGWSADAAEEEGLSEDEDAVQAELLRDVFCGPSRPATVDPAWLRPSFVSFARAAYDERILPSGHLDNARLAVLSDALEEAGCSDEAILSHLRSPGPHVRGCWALDLIMGRERGCGSLMGLSDCGVAPCGCLS